MSGIAWKLRRLMAMPPAEIAYRIRLLLRDRFKPPSYMKDSPAEAFAAHSPVDAPSLIRSSRLRAIVADPLHLPDRGSILRQAEALLDGSWRVFGRDVRLQIPPVWRADPLTGATWDDVPSRNIDYRRADERRSARTTWEIGRLSFVPVLACAYRLTSDERFAVAALAILEDFTKMNPIWHGIHHTSGIEDAIRCINTVFGLALLGERAERPEVGQILGLVAQQAVHCKDNLSLYSSGNNHLIAELAAMTVVGCCLPGLRQAEELARSGFHRLQSEILKQFHPDGISVEQSLGYVPFIWEFILYAMLSAKAAGLQISNEAEHRLASSLQAMRVFRLPNGRTPQIGDEDDGMLLLPTDDASRLDVVGNALACFLGLPLLSDAAPAMNLCAVLPLPSASYTQGALDGVYEFPQGGYTVWRERGLLVTLDHGPLGWGSLAGHGHADALSITIFAGIDPIVLDPGAYAYHEDRAGRDKFRGTSYHSTVVFGGRDQSENLGPFLWGRRATVERREDGWECLWWTGERHWRAVQVSKEGVRVVDRVSAPDAEVVFILHPEASLSIEGTTAKVTSGRHVALFEGLGITAWRGEPGEYSPRYSHRLVCTRLVGRLAGNQSRVSIRVEAA